MQYTVLLILDDKDFSDRLEKALQQNIRIGKVLKKGNGMAGLEECTKKFPDVVIVEDILPILDGMGFLTKLSRCDFSVIRKPAVIYLGFAKPNYDPRSLWDIGVDRFLKKPQSIESIKIATEDCISLIDNNATQKIKEQPYQSIKRIVEQLLLDIGVNTRVKGYLYLISAVMLVVESEGKVMSVTKEIYPAVARQYETTPSGVERAIRHAITGVWDFIEMRNNVDCERLFVGGMKKRPTNAEFINAVAIKARENFVSH